MKVNSVLHKFAKRPKILFLLDGVGAFVSALFLAFILPAIQDKIGLSREHLLYLATFAGFLLLIDVYRFMAANDKWEKRIRLVIMLNLIYCAVSVVVVGLSYQTITALGLIYFAGEIFVILLLVRFERSVYLRVKNPNLMK